MASHLDESDLPGLRASIRELKFLLFKNKLLKFKELTKAFFYTVFLKDGEESIQNIGMLDRVEDELKDGISNQYGHMGAVFFGLNKLKRAKEWYKKAVEMFPTKEIIHNYGEILFQKGDLKQSEKFLRVALGMDPEDPKMYTSYGNLLLSQKRYDEAEKMYLKAIKLDPKSSLAYHNYGTLLALRERFDEADRSFAKAIELEPNEPQFHASYSNFLEDAGKPEKAQMHKEISEGLRKYKGF